MGGSGNGALARLAAAVSDGEAVDWVAEKQAEPQLSSRLDVLEKLALIVSSGAPPRAPAMGATVDGAPIPRGIGTWGHLRILEKIGEGSFGEVYRAFDPQLQTEVALKLWKQAAGAGISAEEFLDEARRLARVRHTNVLQVYGADSRDGRAGMWTELVRGRTLEDALEKQGALGADEATVIALCLCRALAAVHRAGIVHRDVKASNVMREEGGRIVLMDFGSGGKLPPAGQLHVTVSTKGTPLTMAPEQLRGEIAGPATDIYSLGVLLYRLVSGRYPVEAQTYAELVQKHAARQAVPLRDRRPDAPADFLQVVDTALDSDPSRRYASAGAMERALAATAGRGVVVQGHGAENQQHEGAADKERRRRRWVLPASLAAAAVVVVAGIWTWLGSNGDKDRTERAGAPAGGEAGSGSLASESRTQEQTQREGIGERMNAPTAGEAGTVPSSSAQARGLTVKANLFRVTASGHERLLPGGRVGLGDALFLEIEGSEPMHVYVLDEDQAGDLFVLFPTPSFELKNPLAANVMTRLPGTRGGRPAYWQVTSAGGREYVMVVASRQPLPMLERELALLRPADPDRPVDYKTVSDSVVVALMRGMGGVVFGEPNAAAENPSRLSEMLASAGATVQSARDPWVWQIHLENPGR